MSLDPTASVVRPGTGKKIATKFDGTTHFQVFVPGGPSTVGGSDRNLLVANADGTINVKAV